MLKSTTESPGILLMLWMKTKRREKKVKLLKLVETFSRLLLKDLQFWMLQVIRTMFLI